MLEEQKARAVTVAKRYYDAGAWVVPLKGKIPTASSAGFQKKRLPLATIEAGVKFNGNLGLVCGQEKGIICVDIDTRRDGLVWYAANKDKLGTPIVETTPTGGYHLIYRYPVLPNGHMVQNSKDKLAPGVEVLGHNKYFVTAPSVHPDKVDEGLEYSVSEDISRLFSNNIIDQGLGVVSPWLLEQIWGLPQAEPEITIDIAASMDVFKHTPQDLGFARGELIGLGQAYEGQGGDELTLRAAFIGKDYGIHPEAWFEELKKWNEKNEPQWTDGKLWQKIQGTYKYSQVQPGLKSPRVIFSPEVTEQVAKQAEVAAAKPENIATLDAIKDKLKEYPIKKPNECAGALLADFFQGNLTYYADNFYLFLGDVWKELKEEDLSAILRHELRIYGESPNVKSSHIREISIALRDVLIHKNYIPHGFDRMFDGSPGDYVVMENGLLDLNTRLLLAYDKRWFTTNKLPFKYDASAKADVWQKFLTSVWGEDALTKAALQGWIGYCLSSSSRFQKCALFIGASRAGKGVISRMIEKLAGKHNCTGTSLSTIGSTFGLHPLIGKKVCFLQDVHKGNASIADMALERIKQIVGQDAIQINRKNQDITYLRLGCKLILTANEMPGFADANSAMSKRLIVWRFDTSFHGQEDWDLEVKLEHEISGIFNWALEGLVAVKEMPRLLEPTQHLEALEDMDRSMNPIGAFAEDSLVVTGVQSDVITRVDMETVYKQWCQDSGRHPLSSDRLVVQLKGQLGRKVEYLRKRVGVLGALGLENTNTAEKVRCWFGVKFHPEVVLHGVKIGDDII